MLFLKLFRCKKWININKSKIVHEVNQTKPFLLDTSCSISTSSTSSRVQSVDRETSEVVETEEEGGRKTEGKVILELR